LLHNVADALDPVLRRQERHLKQPKNTTDNQGQRNRAENPHNSLLRGIKI
jgi:hypothetical protein